MKSNPSHQGHEGDLLAIANCYRTQQDCLEQHYWRKRVIKWNEKWLQNCISSKQLAIMIALVGKDLHAGRIYI